ncbi:NAD-dependent epimerase/dehydratase family protein [Microvirga antarctica]|uniref:NAD-dependent epimerase/dehydratase family protein n=1 Tax=Microvirga antarctica TaxID=2819233 RepID=UPI001B31774C|nr:NAD-dependent epimerase/dehydratase family protein [Microvirga antarctica]
MSKRYLVTGGCGFIGSHLAEALVRDGSQVTVLDNLSSGRTENLPEGAKLIVGDIRNRSDVMEAARDCDGIFHLAAIASVPKCTQEWHASHEVNLSASVGLFELATERDIPVVYASSSAIYGDVDTTPIGEDTPKQPISAYGVDKYGMELHAFAGARTRGLRSFGLRFFNIYGPRQDPTSPYSGVIAVFMRNAQESRPIVVHGDGGQIRDFVYVTDAVKAVRLAMAELEVDSEPTAQVSNVCTGRPTSIRQLADTVTNLIRPGLEITTSAARAGDILKSIGNPSRLQSLLGFTPSTLLADGLGRMIAPAPAGSGLDATRQISTAEPASAL